MDILFLCSNMVIWSLRQNMGTSFYIQIWLATYCQAWTRPIVRRLSHFSKKKIKCSFTCRRRSICMSHQFFLKDMSCSQRPSYFDQFVATRTKSVSEMFPFLAKKANEATVLPLLIFTNLFHQRFPKHCFLELMLEITTAILYCHQGMCWQLQNSSWQSIPTFYKVYEMSQLHLIKKSRNSKIAIECNHCNIATFWVPWHTWW